MTDNEEQNMKEQNPPIRVDDEVEVEIESRGERGDGVGKCDGFIVFVPGTKVGETVKVQVEKVFKKFAIARKLITEEDVGEPDPSSEDAIQAE